MEGLKERLVGLSKIIEGGLQDLQNNKGYSLTYVFLKAQIEKEVNIKDIEDIISSISIENLLELDKCNYTYKDQKKFKIFEELAEEFMCKATSEMDRIFLTCFVLIECFKDDLSKKYYNKILSVLLVVSRVDLKKI